MTKKVIAFLKGDVMFTISLVFAVITSFFVPIDLSSVNWHTIFSLMAMMIWVGYLESAGVLHRISVQLVNKSHSTRALMTAVMLLSFFGAMFLSNDIAILTLMPIYLRIVKDQTPKLKIIGSTLIIMAANSGSVLFPFGKSQNLYMFTYYNVSVKEFFTWSGSLAVITLILLWIVTRFIKKEPLKINLRQPDPINKPRVAFLVAAGVVLIFTIFGWTPFNVVIPIVLLAFFIYSRKMFHMVDFGLLFTFVFFFITVSNLSRIDFVQETVRTLFDSKQQVMFGTFALSQIISNVPSTILVSSFTEHARELFIGSNIGGYGTVMASMANLIGLRVFRQVEPDSTGTFLKLFMALNWGMALILLAIFGLGFI